MSTVDLGTRIKGYEKSSEFKVAHDEYVIVRIDGHKFSKFTRDFKKPFDKLLSDAMENTTKDLVDKFGAVTGYTQSDEITLVFPPQYKEKDSGEIINNQIFGGRTQKIASLLASFTSIRFNYWLEQGYKSTIFYDSPYDTDGIQYEKMVKDHIGTAWFDARVFGVPSKEEAYNVVMWRTRDAEKNSRSMFAQAYCSHKELLNKNGVEQVEYCLDKTGKDWNTVEERYKYGIFVKKENFEKTGYFDHSDGSRMLSTMTRTRVVAFTEALTSFSEESVDMITRKIKNERVD